MSSRYGLEIRSAAAADAPGVAELLLASGGRTIAPRVLAERLEAIRQSQGAALIALEWGPSGLVVLHWRQTLTDPMPEAEVSLLLVVPDARRRGIGRLLLKAAAQTARTVGCGALHLTAQPDRADLLAFCRATGFTESGERLIRPLRRRASPEGDRRSSTSRGAGEPVKSERR